MKLDFLRNPQIYLSLTLTSPMGSPSESKYSVVDSHVDSDGGGLKYALTSGSLSFFNDDIASSILSRFGLASVTKYSKRKIKRQCKRCARADL